MIPAPGNRSAPVGSGGSAIPRWVRRAYHLALALLAVASQVSVSADEEKSRLEWLAGARGHEEAGDYAKAVAAYDAAAKLGAEDAGLLRRRGIARFMLGDAKGSVADFDRQLAIDPDYAPYDWMRGISLYYAGEFAKGRAQFESHQKVNANDVENAAWHFLCVARSEGVEKARAALIPIEGDVRVPMKEVQALFAGKGTREDVLKAAEAGAEAGRRNQLCYAHLYLALYDEALGETESSLRHIRLAAEKFAMPHYMGQVARVHLLLRGKK